MGQPVTGSGVLQGRVVQGLKQDQTVRIAKYGFGSSFRVRHHANNISLTVADSGDIIQGPILILELAFCIAVPEQYLVMGFEFCQAFGIGEVSAFGMGDGHLEHLAFPAPVGHQGFRGLDSQVDIFGNKLMILIADQCPR
jgi:hypothetical protein